MEGFWPRVAVAVSSDRDRRCDSADSLGIFSFTVVGSTPYQASNSSSKRTLCGASGRNFDCADLWYSDDQLADQILAAGRSRNQQSLSADYCVDDAGICGSGDCLLDNSAPGCCDRRTSNLLDCAS